MSVESIVAKHKTEIDAIRSQLAMNFDTPAQLIINAGFERMGIARFTNSGDDRWEMITCHLNGWEYERQNEEDHKQSYSGA